VALALDQVRAVLGDDLRGAQEAFRTETEAVREAVRTEIQAVREAARTEADGTVRAALATVRAALGEDLRKLRERHEETATNLADGLHATRKEFRTEIESVREGVRTEIQAVREAVRTQPVGPAGEEPPIVDRDAVVAELANQIRDAISSGEQWTPDYDALMTRTGYRRSWCEKAVRDARTAVFDAPDNPGGSLS
jgi:hypothetical protein